MDEVPSPLGMVLWQRFHDVHLWATGHLWIKGATRKRRGLFAEEARNVPFAPYMLSPGQDKELSRALRTLNGLVLEPSGAEEDEVVNACIEIANWAGARNAEATEAAFLGLSALVKPTDPNLACRAGRVERKRGEYIRSVDWFRRAVSVARREGDDPAYIDAYLGRGLTEEKWGRHDRARHCYMKAYRRARETGLTKLGARARHNMIALSVPPLGSLEDGLAHAEVALKLYGRVDPRIPSLASDIAALWNEHGIFAPCLPVLELTLPLMDRLESTATLANIARAAAVVGDEERFFTAWEKLGSLDRKGNPFMAAALAEVAEAARTMRLDHQAYEIAEEALRLAERRNEPGAQEKARGVLSALREGAPRTVDRDAPPAVLSLADRLVERLRRLPR